jgi:hypothetical protein
VDEVEVKNGRYQLCVEAEANYDEAQSLLVVQLDSFLRPADFKQGTHRLSPDWLPRKESVKESVASDEAMDVAKEIFHRWVKRVHHSNPMAADR